MITMIRKKGQQDMKVLIDINVILDVLCNRKDFVEASSKIWKCCETGKIQGYVSALSIPNIVYILRKELTPEKTRQIIDRIFLIFKVVDLKAEDLKKAAAMYPSDYEDALQEICAARIKADHIVTRNVKNFTDSKIFAVKPFELLEKL